RVFRAEVLRDTRRTAEARDLLVPSLATLREVYGDDHRNVRRAATALVDVYETLGQSAKAEEIRPLAEPPSG
ncbi:MAG TPA: tetratricopeptide repeat protein, partial [bacterium]|nr:tetratricopeptide repeat protein [bacterium]